MHLDLYKYFSCMIIITEAKEVEVHTEKQEESEKDDGMSKIIEMNAGEGGIRIAE
jgi:hypothetical protein